MAIERRNGFVPNHREFGMHIRSEIARKPAMKIAKLIAASANANVNVQEDNDRESKRRKANRPAKGSYTSRADGNLRVGGNFRAVAVVSSTAASAIASEGASKYRVKADRPLLKAAIAVSIAELGGFDGHGN